MDIWDRSKILEIICQNLQTKDELKLYYTITSTDIASRWVGLVNKNNELNNKLRFNYRKILSDAEIEAQFLEFKSNIEYINANYDILLPEITSVENVKLNANVLNDLHEQFEVYGDRLEAFIQEGYFNNPKASPKYNPVWPGDSHNKILHEAFLRINEQIHNFEAILRTWDRRTKSICTCLVDFMPNKKPEEVLPGDYLHLPLKPEDYILFDAEHHWGWLYLGYNTLGKHWQSACNDNDIEVVRRKQIRPQERFAAEMYMSFRGDTPHYARIALNKWWVDNDFSEFIDPDLKLKDLALGFIPIAQLESYAINNQSIVNLSKSQDIASWNLNVWSKFNSIKSVKVINK